MFDCFNRRIHYLRVSVTDRCNLRCAYCMPADGVELIPREKILSFEEIRDVVVAAVDLGIDKVRLTGGEPLVRRDVVELVRLLAVIPGIRDLAMTTNGQLLPTLAAPLRHAGLHRLNISLDAMDPTRYAAITRGGRLASVLEGIEAARRAGFTSIKLNCVIEQSADEPDARAVADFAAQAQLPVRYIRRMDTHTGQFSQVLGGHGGDCAHCNRLRLLSDGTILPCLFGTQTYSVRDLGAAEALRLAIQNKPACGQTGSRLLCTTGG
jgi:cyclic pyranopterin phosphate synthase